MASVLVSILALEAVAGKRPLPWDMECYERYPPGWLCSCLWDFLSRGTCGEFCWGKYCASIGAYSCHILYFAIKTHSILCVMFQSFTVVRIICDGSAAEGAVTFLKDLQCIVVRVEHLQTDRQSHLSIRHWLKIAGILFKKIVNYHQN